MIFLAKEQTRKLIRLVSVQYLGRDETVLSRCCKVKTYMDKFRLDLTELDIDLDQF